MKIDQGETELRRIIRIEPTTVQHTGDDMSESSRHSSQAFTHQVLRRGRDENRCIQWQRRCNHHVALAMHSRALERLVYIALSRRLYVVLFTVVVPMTHLTCSASSAHG